MSTATAQPSLPTGTWDTKRLAKLFGVHPYTIRNWERDGRIPRGRRISPKVVRWTDADIAPLLAARG